MNTEVHITAQPGIIAYLWACADLTSDADDDHKIRQEQMCALANVLIDVFLSKRKAHQYETQESKATIIQ